MMEHLGRKGRKTKKVKPPTIKEEKDLMREMQQAFEANGEPDEPISPEVLFEFGRYEDFINKPKTEIIRTLEACIEWLNASEDELNDAAVRLIDERLQSHAKKSQVFMVVAVQKRMESLLKIMEAADMMETRLLDPANIYSMPMDELRKTLELMEKKAESIFKQIAVMIDAAGILPKQFHDESKLPTLLQSGEKVFKDPLVRDNVRTRLDNLLAKKRDE